MNSAIERLLTLRVSDVMHKRVISVSAVDTMAQAAQTLLKHSISGAPVLDASAKCAGMISAIDFVKKHSGHRKPGVAQDAADRNDELVRHHMTSAVHSVEGSEPLIAAARLMCSHHIHRLPVFDKDGHPIGMVTALDIVAALVNAIEE